MNQFVRVKSVQPLVGYRVDIQFTDGSRREINLEPYLHGPIFEPVRNNPAEFCSMHIEGGTIAWSNGADIDPDVLFYGLTPAWATVKNDNEDECTHSSEDQIL